MCLFWCKMALYYMASNIDPFLHFSLHSQMWTFLNNKLVTFVRSTAVWKNCDLDSSRDSWEKLSQVNQDCSDRIPSLKTLNSVLNTQNAISATRALLIKTVKTKDIV